MISLLSKGPQESSLAPQFKSINSLALSLLYGPILTSVHDYWKNHSFDYMDFCRQSDVSAFSYAVWVCHSFSFKEQASSNFMEESKRGMMMHRRPGSLRASHLSFPWTLCEYPGKHVSLRHASCYPLGELTVSGPQFLLLSHGDSLDVMISQVLPALTSMVLKF